MINVVCKAITSTNQTQPCPVAEGGGGLGRDALDDFFCEIEELLFYFFLRVNAISALQRVAAVLFHLVMH